LVQDHHNIHTLLLREIKDIKGNHLASIYTRLGTLETRVQVEGRWVRWLMSGTLTGVLVIAGSLLALVVKAL